jgi:Protein of unknown function (DUF2637)
MSGRAGQWIRWTTTACVGLLALIAGIVSYLHMHMLVALHGQPGWVAVLTPLSVDGMIVAASTTLLSDSRSGSRGGVLPWAWLVVGSVASLAANVAVAEPTVTGRVIAAWPSFALTGAIGHCPLFSFWCVEESGCFGFDLDAEASALSVVDVDGGQLTVSDLLKHGGAG